VHQVDFPHGGPIPPFLVMEASPLPCEAEERDGEPLQLSSTLPELDFVLGVPQGRTSRPSSL
jgi:hypothetical protein